MRFRQLDLQLVVGVSELLVILNLLEHLFLYLLQFGLSLRQQLLLVILVQLALLYLRLIIGYFLALCLNFRFHLGVRLLCLIQFVLNDLQLLVQQ